MASDGSEADGDSTPDAAPEPAPPPIAVRARSETGKTSETAAIASTPRRLTK